MLILFFCTHFATFGYKRPCDFETLFHIVARVFPAISACFNTSVGTAFDNAVSAPVFRLTTRTGNLFIRHEMIPIPDLHPQLGSMAEFFVCLFIWMCNIPWAGSTIISASRYYLFHYPLPTFALLTGPYRLNIKLFFGKSCRYAIRCHQNGVVVCILYEPLYSRAERASLLLRLL